MGSNPIGNILPSWLSWQSSGLLNRRSWVRRPQAALMRYSLTGRASDSDSGGCRFESCYRSFGYVAQWQSIRLLTEGLWVRVPPYPLFQDSGGGRAPASYAEGYGIPRRARSSKRGIPQMPAPPFPGLMLF